MRALIFFWGGGGTKDKVFESFFAYSKLNLRFLSKKNFFSEYYHGKASSKASLKLYGAHVVYFILI